MAGASSHCVEKLCWGTTILAHPGMVRNPSYLPYVSQTTPLSIILVCGTNLIKSAVLYCLADAPCHFTKGRVLKVSPSPIQGHVHSSIPDSDSIKSGTRLLLTDTNIRHNIVWPIHFLQACRKCTWNKTWKPYVLSCLAMACRRRLETT